MTSGWLRVTAQCIGGRPLSSGLLTSALHWINAFVILASPSKLVRCSGAFPGKQEIFCRGSRDIFLGNKIDTARIIDLRSWLGWGRLLPRARRASLSGYDIWRQQLQVFPNFHRTSWWAPSAFLKYVIRIVKLDDVNAKRSTKKKIR